VLVFRSVTGSNRLDPDNLFFSDIRINAVFIRIIIRIKISGSDPVSG
jgi:hypothetical protein